MLALCGCVLAECRTEQNRTKAVSIGIQNTITKTCQFKYTEIFTTKKWKLSDENFW